VGNAGRETLTLDASPLIGGNRALIGVYLAPEIASDRVHDNIARLIRMAAEASLEVVVDRRFALAEAAEAHAYIESRRAVGRVLLVP
jgi:NADPH:quinone reductase